MIVVLRTADTQTVFANVQRVMFTKDVAHLEFVDSPRVGTSGVKSARVFDDRGKELSSWTGIAPRG